MFEDRRKRQKIFNFYYYKQLDSQDYNVDQIIIEQNQQEGHFQAAQHRNKLYRSLFGLFFSILALIQKYETIWKILFVVVSIVAALLFNKIYIFQTHEEFKDVRVGNIWQLLKYALPFAIIFTLSDGLIHKIFDPLCAKHHISLQRFTEKVAREKKCYTLVKWGYSIIYYLITSIWAYKIMCDTTFMPEWLGGKGKDIYTQSRQYPSCPQATFEMNIFYMIQAGKHFSRFISHVFIRPEGAYFEYVLHHGLSVFLIVFSYLSNQWLVGIFVLLIHDFSDVGIHVVRVYRDYKHMNKLVKNIMQIPVFAIWIICRNFLLSYQCIYVGIVNFQILIQNIAPLAYDTMALPLSFMIFMMICLELLQVYFTLQVIQFVIESNKPDKKKIQK